MRLAWDLGTKRFGSSSTLRGKLVSIGEIIQIFHWNLVICC